MRVMGIDPGLTRCGLGVVDVDASRRASLVYVGVARTDKDLATHFRLRTIADAIDSVIERYEPEVVAIERVFAQDNLRSVIGVAQVMGTAMATAARAGLEVAQHTPSEAKAAVTGVSPANTGKWQALAQGLADFSTTEQRTGLRWVDGKPVYTKMLVRTVSGAGGHEVPNGISNPGLVWVDPTATFFASTSNAYNYPHGYLTSGGDRAFAVTPRTNGSNDVYCLTSGAGTIYVRILYTKATD